jgi:cytochrome oxidase Cu insertion factor (SCO1/SenC/PrrC family)
MDHSSSVLLADPQGRFHGVFAPPHDAQNMARGFLEMRRR